MALLDLNEEEILELEVTDPYEEGEEKTKEGILDIKVHLNNCKNKYRNAESISGMIGRKGVFSIIAGCLQKDLSMEVHMGDRAMPSCGNP